MIRRLWRRCLLRWRLRRDFHRIVADPLQEPQTFETSSSYRTEMYNYSLIEFRRQCLQRELARELARAQEDLEAGFLNMQRGIMMSDTSSGGSGGRILQHYSHNPFTWDCFSYSSHSSRTLKQLSKKEDIDFIDNVKEEI